MTARQRVLVLDNYDSFTWNLVQGLETSGAACEVWRSDALDCDDIRALNPNRVVLSPGPFGPEQAGVCLRVVTEFPDLPILGICLGMQVIAAAGGARVVPSGRPAHGVARPVEHAGEGVLAGLPSPMEAGLYHSLIVDPPSLTSPLRLTAWTADHTVMGCRLDGTRAQGLMFHPESFLTPLGGRILVNFLTADDVG